MARKISWLYQLDFCLCDHVKSIVYATAVNNIEELKQEVQYGWELIRNTAGIFERVQHSLVKSTACSMEAQW
jgi:hypothetical protein